jgi:hypothetical protein
MGKLRACHVVACLALAGCGSDSAQPDALIVIPDAPPDAAFLDAPLPVYDFSCTGNPLPTTANASITLSGTVSRISIVGGTPSIDPLDGATVAADLCRVGTNCNGPNHQIGTTTTAGGGEFSLGPFDTNSIPLDGFLQMTHTGSRTVYVYPPVPFTADQGSIPVLTFTPTAVGLLTFFGCTQTAGTGMIAVALTDCANAPIDDKDRVTFTVSQGGTAVAGLSPIHLGDFVAEAAGAYLICSVPVGDPTNVTASWDGMAMRALDVKVVGDTTTTTLLRPGPF